MPVTVSSFAFSVVMGQEGEMRRSAAREGWGAEVLEVVEGTEMRIVMSGVVRWDMLGKDW